MTFKVTSLVWKEATTVAGPGHFLSHMLTMHLRPSEAKRSKHLGLAPPPNIYRGDHMSALDEGRWSWASRETCKQIW